MTSVLSLLKDDQDVEATLVELSNGVETLAFKKGTVHLNLTLIVNNVCLFPD